MRHGDHHDLTLAKSLYSRALCSAMLLWPPARRTPTVSSKGHRNIHRKGKAELPSEPSPTKQPTMLILALDVEPQHNGREPRDRARWEGRGCAS